MHSRFTNSEIDFFILSNYVKPMAVDSFKFLVEQNLFGVCERIGERLHMPAKNIRLFFIYASCMTIGSPIIIYMILAFWMKMKHYVRNRRTAVWDF